MKLWRKNQEVAAPTTHHPVRVVYAAGDGPQVEPALDALAQGLSGRFGNMEGSHGDRWVDYLFPTRDSANAFAMLVRERELGETTET